MTSYQSVDALQRALAAGVFSRTQSPKKAAGRALGGLVELITFYMLRDWQLERNLAIERGLKEYGNPLISHNVEFTLHASELVASSRFENNGKSITARRIVKENPALKFPGAKRFPNNSLIAGGVVRHAATLVDGDGVFWNASSVEDGKYCIQRLVEQPFAMFECKRVGIEEGMTKGPQTIEKAKQGAYVARTVSGLQRIPRRDGSVAALVEEADGSLTTHPDYYKFIRDAIDQGDLDALANVVLTVGVVSNHGNWFTAETQNKEMLVLAQSYDWLLFLTDLALAEFIETAINGSDASLAATRRAFNDAYVVKPSRTKFTKVVIDIEADRELTAYFASEKPWNRWFNVITPTAPLADLQSDLTKLADIHEKGPRT